MGKCTGTNTTKNKGGRTPRIRRVVPSFKRVRQNTRNTLEIIRTKVKNMPQCLNIIDLDLRQMIKRNITKFRQITCWEKNNHPNRYEYRNNNNSNARAYEYVSSYATDRQFRTRFSASMAASVLMSVIPGAGGVVAIAAKSASACILSTVVSDAYLRKNNNTHNENKFKYSRKKSPMDKAMDMAKRKRKQKQKHRHVPEQIPIPVPVPFRSADESESSSGNNGSNREGVVFMKVNV
jgi:ribosomal protein S13